MGNLAKAVKSHRRNLNAYMRGDTPTRIKAKAALQKDLDAMLDAILENGWDPDDHEAYRWLEENSIE